MKRKLFLGILGIFLALSCAGGAWSDESKGPYTIMKPDRETRLRWIQDYEMAPRAYIDKTINFSIMPGGSLSLLSHLQYIPSERNQGSCGNCWAWAGTGAMGIALDVEESILDRLSVQFISSCNTAKSCCDGGWLSDLADFYTIEGYTIPWSNTNANWQNGDGNCNVPCGSIATSPNYGIDSIEAQTVETHSVGQAQAIANIKNVLNQNKAVWFAFFMGTQEDWDNFNEFWGTQTEATLWNFDPTCGEPYTADGGGHAVLCVGYNDDDPSNSYWIMLNSWGTAGGDRPHGIFRLDMNMDYDCADSTGDYNLYWQTLDVSFNFFAPGLIYFPHIASNATWETEICAINTSDSRTLNGIFKAYSDAGVFVSEIDAVTLAPHGRREITVGDEFTDPDNIGYIVFKSDSDTVVGYTKFYIEGIYRAAVPAVREINTGDIYVSHIASTSNWWTGVSLVNTTSASKELTIEFDNGEIRTEALAANEHRAFTIASLFGGQAQPDINSAVIKQGSGVVGLELFSSIGSARQLSGILLKDDTSSRIYYPHVASNATWWTGLVAYNSSASASTIIITPYTEAGDSLATTKIPIGGKEKYIGAVAGLNLPVDTAWLQIDATSPITGFELFGTNNGNQLAGYTGVGISGKEGAFAKLEKDGWTGIAFVNTEDSSAIVTLTAYDDSGAVTAIRVIDLDAHEKVVNTTEDIFAGDDITNATYITYSSNREVVGFQLNASSDGIMLDGLPGM